MSSGAKNSVIDLGLWVKANEKLVDLRLIPWRPEEASLTSN